MALRVKNWNEFQHYKDRSPPWIKLQKGLLDDYEYQCLPVASRAIAPMIWLLASEQIDGEISEDLQKIAFRLRMRVEDVKTALEPLIHAGFVISDSSLLASCKQHAMPETETETETETEEEKTNSSTHKKGRPQAIPKPDDVSQEVWDEFVQLRKKKKASVTKLVIDGIQREADKAGWSLEDVLTKMVMRGWQGFEANWVANEQPPRPASNPYSMVD